MKQESRSKNQEKGFTLFVAIAIAGTLMLVGVGLVTMSTKQAILTSSATESQRAFYAADTGIECALYWDVKDSLGVFATSTPQIPFSCGGTLVTNLSKTTSANNGTTNFTILGDYCVDVTVEKTVTGTKIESRGYNTCDSTNPRRVQRAVRATY